jgi:hypothetical protein
LLKIAQDVVKKEQLARKNNTEAKFLCSVFVTETVSCQKEGETEVVATEEGEKSGCLQRLICQICFLAAGQSDQEWQPAS